MHFFSCPACPCPKPVPYASLLCRFCSSRPTLLFNMKVFFPSTFLIPPVTLPSRVILYLFLPLPIFEESQSPRSPRRRSDSGLFRLFRSPHVMNQVLRKSFPAVRTPRLLLFFQWTTLAPDHSFFFFSCHPAFFLSLLFSLKFQSPPWEVRRDVLRSPPFFSSQLPATSKLPRVLSFSLPLEEFP